MWSLESSAYPSKRIFSHRGHRVTEIVIKPLRRRKTEVSGQGSEVTDREKAMPFERRNDFRLRRAEGVEESGTHGVAQQRLA